MYGFVFTDNIVGSGKYPIFSSGGGPTNCATSGSPAINLSHCFSTYIFKSNVIVGAAWPFPPSVWPAGNHFSKDIQAVDFLDYNSGDYSLLPSSPYRNAGTGGTTPGADIEAIETAILGVY
jgi:hypothetical protein